MKKEHIDLEQKKKDENIKEIQNDEVKRDVIEKKNNEFSKLKEYVGILSAIIAFFTIVGSVLMKYISIGRYIYFEFDLDYCEFSLTNTVVMIFIFTVIATIISGIISFVTNRLCRLVLQHCKKKIHKVATRVVFVLINVTIYFFISLLFIPEDNLAALFFAILCFFAITIYIFINIFDNGLEKINNLKLVSGVLATIILIVAVSLMRMEFEKAEEQTTFPLIIDEKGDDRYYYVVINKGKEMYSAYLCGIVEDTKTLNIIINEHKYFPINETKTYNIAFDCVERYEKNDLSVDEFLQMDYEHID